MTKHRITAFGLVVSLLAGLTGTAGAADPTDPEAARDDARRKRAGLATDLDVLAASEAELLAAAEALAAEVRAQEAAVAASERSVEVAATEVREAEERLAETRAEIARLTSRLVDRAVDSFIAPERSSLYEVAVSANFTDAARKQAYIGQVIADEAALVGRLDQARVDLEVDQDEAEAARARATRRQVENIALLASLEEAAAEQARVQAAIEARQEEVVAEIDALAAAEAELSALIEQRAREQREAEERARAEAAAAAAAAAAQAQAERDRVERDRAAADGSARQRAAEEAARDTRRPSAPQRSQTEPGTSTGGGGCIWPTRGVVTSEYGSRWGRLHAGIDIAAPTGTPIYAARPGTVLVAEQQGGYGMATVLDHGDMTTLYGHQSRFAAGVGEQVAQGELIGYVGNTGNSTGPHLHFETRYDGTPRNPRPCLP